MKIIRLHPFGIALIDDDDYELISKFKWERHRQGYAMRKAYLGGGRSNAKYRTLLMHRVIMGDPKGKQVDHRNLIKWDNQKPNLRIATYGQNGANKPARAKSGYKGVYWSQYTWQAAIHINGKRVALGRFRDPLDAARAYDKAALAHWGEFARLNNV